MGDTVVLGMSVGYLFVIVNYAVMACKLWMWIKTRSAWNEVGIPFAIENYCMYRDGGVM